jgi:hypothetical protein
MKVLRFNSKRVCMGNFKKCKTSSINQRKDGGDWRERVLKIREFPKLKR